MGCQLKHALHDLQMYVGMYVCMYVRTYVCMYYVRTYVCMYKFFFGGGTAVAHWLRCYSTNRKVAGSIPDGVIGIFHWHNPPDRTIGPEFDTASNRNEYQEDFLWVNVAGA